MSEDTTEDTELQVLTNDIAAKVREFCAQRPDSRGRPTFAVARPEKAVEALTLLSTGQSAKKVYEITGATPNTVSRLKSDFADYLGEWKSIGGQVSGGLYFEASEYVSDLFEDLRLAREAKDWDAVKALSSALASTNKVVEVSNRHAMNARGEATQHIKVDKTATVEDVQKAAEDALKLIQEAEIVDES
jgi:hypothetical protein